MLSGEPPMDVHIGADANGFVYDFKPQATAEAVGGN
jgi:hypothetical protein